MIDNGQIKQATQLLRLFLDADDFRSDEKDTKQMMTSLLGILLKNLGETQAEKDEGLQILEEAK